MRVMAVNRSKVPIVIERFAYLSYLRLGVPPR